MDLSTMSPVEIDTVLSELSEPLNRAHAGLSRARESLHYAAGDQQVRRTGWRMTTAQARVTAEARAADESLPQRKREAAQVALDAVVQADAALGAAEAAMAPYHAEYDRRPWSRFLLVQDGHIHSSRHCRTLHHGETPTPLYWQPELSGKTMADAIAHFEAQARGRSEVLCSACFSDAPLAWTLRPVDASLCPGSNTAHYDRHAKTTRIGYAAGNGATCTDCGKWVSVSSLGNMRKHKRAEGGEGPVVD